MLELPIQTLAFGGKGVAKVDDFVVFVTGAVPGDVVRVTITKAKKRYAEARVVELLTPSPDRTPASVLHVRTLRRVCVAGPRLPRATRLQGPSGRANRSSTWEG